MRKVDWAERYQYNIRRQRRALEEYAAHEIEWADDLLLWYRLRKQEIPDDEYRAVAYFKNKEYLGKPGSLTLLYSMYEQMMKELPPPTKEIAFDLVAFRFKMYAAGLEKEGI
jgi:hypothetical protein